MPVLSYSTVSVYALRFAVKKFLFAALQSRIILLAYIVQNSKNYIQDVGAAPASTPNPILWLILSKIQKWIHFDTAPATQH
jgi:hypothetical protein